MHASDAVRTSAPAVVSENARVPILAGFRGILVGHRACAEQIAGNPGLALPELPFRAQARGAHACPVQLHFKEFEQFYGPDPNGRSKRKDLGPECRFRKFHISEIKDRNYKLDIMWLRDETLEDADDMPEPEELRAEAVAEVESAVVDLEEIAGMLEGGGGKGNE